MTVRLPGRGALAACIVIAALPGAAWATYTTIGGGTVAAQVATLPAPSITAATPGGGSVGLSWSAASAPGGGAVGYVVLRDGVVAGGACGTTAAPITATSCTDADVPTGAHSYTVRALWRTWSATSTPVSATVASGPAARLVLSSAASTLAAGDTTTITVRAQDAQGTTVSAWNGTHTVVFAGAANAGSAHPTVTPSGGAAVAFGSGTDLDFDAGVATGTLRLVKAESASLTAAVGAVTTTTGLPVTVTAGAPATVAATSGSGQTAAGSAAFANPLVATVTDAYANPVGSATVTFTAPASGASGTFAGGSRTTTATTNSAGAATSSTFTANATGGTYAVTATVAGATSATFTLTNAVTTTATTLALANSSGATAGQPDAGDTIAVTFNQPIAPASVCTGWTGAAPLTGVTATMNRTGNGVNATMTFAAPACTAFRLGTLNLGSSAFFTQGSTRSGTFSGSTIAYDAATRRLTVTLGTYAGDTRGAVASATATFTPASGLLDANGLAVATTPVSVTGQPF